MQTAAAGFYWCGGLVMLTVGAGVWLASVVAQAGKDRAQGVPGCFCLPKVAGEFAGKLGDNSC